MRALTGLTAAAIVLGAGTVSGHAAPLRMAVEGDGAYAPFSFFDKSGKLTGFDIDIARALCAQLPDGCEIIPVNWELIIDGLESRKYDAAVASIGFSKERAARVLFGVPYCRSHSVFIGHPGRFTAVTPEALAGVKLTASQGTIQLQFLRDHFKASTIIEAKDFDDEYAKLKDGSADLALGDQVVFMDFLQTDAGADFGFVGDPLSGDALQGVSFLALSKGLDDKATALADALKHIRLDGTYDRINRSYVPFSIW